MEELYSKIDFQNKRNSLFPTLCFCILFFIFYYILLIIPHFGINSEIFLIDQMGGSCVVLGFLLAIVLSKKFEYDFILMLPSFGTVAATSIFLLHKNFYFTMGHLWMSAQVMGVIFSIFLGSPRLNVILYVINVFIPPVIASQVDYLDWYTIMTEQAVVYFASLTSIYLSYNHKKNLYELLKSRDRARDAEKAKTDFLANMSHEIRTPMNGVLGNVELLCGSKALPKKEKAYAKNIADSGRAMMAVLNDILDLSKIEAGYLKVDPHHFNLHELLQAVINLYDNQASIKGLSLELKLSDKTPKWIYSDSNRIRQIVSNLVGNAIKFTDSGGVSITVVREGQDEDEFNLKFSIKDSGIGLKKDQVERIFDNFSQADTSTTRKYGGTGLGLTICKKLSQLLGGDISVESEFNYGSTFSFSVKVQIGTPPDADLLSTVSSPTPCDYKKLHILLVEDNAINQSLAIAFLKQLNISPKLATNGKEAVESAKTQSFDIILMDCQMPVMDGYAATKEIKAFLPGDKPVIIAMTANVMDGDKKRCIESGMNDYISKPISRKSLEEIIKKWCVHSKE